MFRAVSVLAVLLATGLPVASAAAAESEAAQLCDARAGRTGDPDLPAGTRGLLMADMDGAAALEACTEAVRSAPGNRRLIHQLGRAHHKLGQFGPALAHFRVAGAFGSAAALTSIGYMVENGQGVAANPKRARQLYRLAAKRGDATAWNNLGVIYRDGEGVRRSDRKAARFFRKGAARGSPQAMNSLGALLEEGGKGVRRDARAAIALYRQAAEQGEPVAMLNLGDAYTSGTGGLAIDLAAARAWYEKAVAAGDAEAKDRLAKLDAGK